MTNEHKRTRRAFLGAVGAGSALGTIGTLTNTVGAADLQEETWTLGTSAEGSSSFRIGTVWTEFFGREGLWDEVGVEVEAVVTEGTSATYRRVDAGELELGGTTTQLLEDSPDEGPFEETPVENFDQIRQIRGYMNFNNYGVVNLDAGVESWDDLEGRPVAISSIGSGTRPIVELVVDQEIGIDNIDNRYMAFADIPGALRGGVVDAAFTWTTNETIPIGFAEEIDATVNWAPLELSDETIEHIQEEVPFSSYSQLGEDTVGEMFQSYEGPLDTFTLGYLYAAFAERDPDVIYEITRLTHEYGEELVETDEIMGLFPDPELFMDMHPEVPVHEGAWRYYEEEQPELLEEFDLTPPPELEE